MTTGLDPCQKCVEIWPKWRFWRMKRCICHHWTPATEFYVLCAPRIRWGGVKGAVGRSWGPWQGLSSIPIQNIWGFTGSLGKVKWWKITDFSNGLIDGLLDPIWVESSQDHFWRFQLKTNSEQKLPKKIPGRRWWTWGVQEGEFRSPPPPTSSSGTPTASQS